MSFDIYLEKHCKECDSITFGFTYNITHNTNGIVDACLGPFLVGKGVDADGKPAFYNDHSWGRLEGRTALETRSVLKAALEKVLTWSDEFEKQLPANGGGTRGSVTDAIRRAHDAALHAPVDAVWRTSG